MNTSYDLIARYPTLTQAMGLPWDRLPFGTPLAGLLTVLRPRWETTIAASRCLLMYPPGLGVRFQSNQGGRRPAVVVSWSDSVFEMKLMSDKWRRSQTVVVDGGGGAGGAEPGGADSWEYHLPSDASHSHPVSPLRCQWIWTGSVG